MTPLRIRFSNHALNERADRIAYIATTIGFGEIIARKLVVDERGKAMRLLTDTGVIIVTDPHEECILTMWIADPTQVKDFYPDGVRNQAVLRLVKKYMEKGYQDKQNKQKKGLYVLSFCQFDGFSSDWQRERIFFIKKGKVWQNEKKTPKTRQSFRMMR